jgi:hypothetical protein
VLVQAENDKRAAENALEHLDQLESTELDIAESALKEAHAIVSQLEQDVEAARLRANTASQLRDDARTQHNEARAKLEFLLQSAPSVNVTVAEAALAQCREKLASFGDESACFPEDLKAAETLVEQRQADLRRTEDELHAARGKLELVGGTVARDERDQEIEALDCLRRSAKELELEYKSTKRLLDVLKEAEEKHTAHLGRKLAEKVTKVFRELTEGRYAQVGMDGGLRVQNVAAEGSERGLPSLSVGTREQLATLVRVALAANLKSVVILDDQLTQSDPCRLAWFQERLRASVRDYAHQIIVITCRPRDYLRPEEMPAVPCDRWETADGLVIADLGAGDGRGAVLKAKDDSA